MYLLATTQTYQKDTKYYSKSGDTYTLLLEETDYRVGDTIQGEIYEMVKYDTLYIRPYGSTGAYSRFPYIVDGVNTLPEHDAGANDVDVDAYTNTAGYTVRNRVRHDVATLEFNISTMVGKELFDLFDTTTDVWLDCYFFYEPEYHQNIATNGFTSKKMYRNATVKYHKYYIDATDPNKNIYQNVNFGFVEE